MELYLIGIGIFVFVVIIIELVVYAVRNMRSTKRVKIRKRLRNYAYIDGGEDGTDILKKRIYYTYKINFSTGFLFFNPQ